MAAFTVSKPKPECSRSNSTKSQPADFMIWPIPGVANSTTKCPKAVARLPAKALRQRSLMNNSSQPTPSWPLLSGGTFTDQLVLGNRLVGDQRCARFGEHGEMPCLHMRVERRPVVV